MCRAKLSVERGGAYKPRGRALERRATESESDRATREFCVRIRPRVVDHNFENDLRGLTRPGRMIATRVRIAYRNGVSVPDLLDAGYDWIADLIMAEALAVTLAGAAPPPTGTPVARAA